MSLYFASSPYQKFQDIVIKKVEPKKKKIEEVQTVLATAQAELAQKMAEVNKDQGRRRKTRG
jgi:hypothetical protein